MQTPKCLKHSKYHIKTRFCNVQGTTKIVQQILATSFKNRPKIHAKSIPEAFQNDPPKNTQKKIRKFEKNAENGLPKGPRRAANFRIFGVFFCPGGLWTLKWPKSRPQEAPKAGPKSLRGPFWVIFVRFFISLGMIFPDLRLVPGDQCSGHGGGRAAGKWIRRASP